MRSYGSGLWDNMYRDEGCPTKVSGHTSTYIKLEKGISIYNVYIRGDS